MFLKTHLFISLSFGLRLVGTRFAAQRADVMRMDSLNLAKPTLANKRTIRQQKTTLHRKLWIILIILIINVYVLAGTLTASWPRASGCWVGLPHRSIAQFHPEKNLSVPLRPENLRSQDLHVHAAITGDLHATKKKKFIQTDPWKSSPRTRSDRWGGSTSENKS